MNGFQLTATSIIDILCLETIVEGNAAEVVQHIILNLSDALIQVFRQSSVGIVEVFRTLTITRKTISEASAWW